MSVLDAASEYRLPDGRSIPKRNRILGVALIFAVVLAGCKSQGVFSKRAKEGHGLLPRPATLSGPTVEITPTHAFIQESPNLYSRVLFETDEGGDFTIQIREYSLPPHQGLTTIHTAGDAILELRTDRGRLMIGDKEQTWKQGAMLAVATGIPIQVANPTDRELIIRLHILEAK
jgi:hypothetical protein